MVRVGADCFRCLLKQPVWFNRVDRPIDLSLKPLQGWNADQISGWVVETKFSDASTQENRARVVV